MGRGFKLKEKREREKMCGEISVYKAVDIKGKQRRGEGRFVRLGRVG